ncbi:protein kinase, partial [Streptomyces sp. SID5910]|uniref:serine/threonine-protein kinase n=1 Tax=Streptomyces sp. SID5910 TaxID=2690312 RepID=UPI00136D0006
EGRLRRLGAALAEALAAIHSCGLVHRDLKPGNIIMAADGPRVLDFGIARAMESTRLTSTGVAFGTPGFLAPEQAMGEEVSGAADVFALGAVLVAAAGGSAFGGGTPMGLMYRAVHEPADLSSVPPGLRPMLIACLAKDPAQRPAPAGLLDLFSPAPGTYSPTEVVLPPMDAVPPYQAPTAPSYPPPYPPAAPSAAPWGVPAPGPTDADISFVAADATSAVLVDAEGVAFESDVRYFQFTWDRVSTVEYAAGPQKYLWVTVRLHDGTVHQQAVKARRTSQLRRWLEDLPLVIACFR